MSCNGCRVLRKGCSESCVLRPCLEWINTAQSQANATAFLAKFYGRTGLINLISNGPQSSGPALFRSLLYEACGRILNPIYGSVGLLWSGNWEVCQAGVESILQGNIPNPLIPCDERNEEHQILNGRAMHSTASGLHKVKASCKFKCVNPRRKPKSQEAQFLNQIQTSSGQMESGGIDIIKMLHGKEKCCSSSMASQQPDDLGGEMNYNTLKSEMNYNTFHSFNPKVEALYMQNSEVKVEVELELTLGAQRTSFPHKFVD
ncbi:LOB domain-containing protein 39 [Cryptomeria japonica]|uniref:LOB domain-containing protein 39 n=1 Tax=Cryptomeria japonica TaxID=3369 RepID=UPI0025ABE0BD|nr:LOB domain-containing protein 39 [Cryptomeria japonica]XP_057838489.1 LOB domain-containing protein 39 [Cryptomeria japonica]